MIVIGQRPSTKC